jgi:hypothetical protein
VSDVYIPTIDPPILLYFVGGGGGVETFIGL